MIPPDVEAHIQARIRRIRGPRRGDAQELRSHILDAAPATVAQADAAFDALGDDREIRAAFFPARPRVPLGKMGAGGIILAVALLLLAGVVDDAESSCTLTGPGTCSARTAGEVADTAMLVAGPLIVAAILHWWVAWTGLLPAAALASFTYVRLEATRSIGADAEWAWIEFAASLVTLAVVVRHLILDRRATA